MSDDPKDAERRRKLEELEQRLADLIQEDLGKEIPDHLAGIHEESLKNKGAAVSPITRTLARFASLLGALYIRRIFKPVESSNLRGPWFFSRSCCLFSRLISAMTLISMTSAQNRSVKTEP